MTRTTLEHALAGERAALPGAPNPAPWRTQALADFAAAGIPTTRHERWRYTDLKPLASANPELAPNAPDAAAIAAAARAVETLALAPGAARVVFVDGHFVRELSSGGPAGTVEIADLEPGLPRASHGPIDAAVHPLAALNAAFMTSGVAVSVPEGAQAGALELVLVASGANVAPQPRVALRLGRGAELSVVQQVVDVADGAGWLNLVTEVEQAPESRLAFCRVQQLGAARGHTSLLAVGLGRGASASIGLVDLGGRLVRNDVDVALREPGAGVELFGLFLAGAGRHVDDHTRITHAAPDTRSDEAFRGVIGRRGRGVFNGKVVVERGAHRTDARQSNDNLLLSEQAEVDTKPELEIYCDDVKCSHGSTVGELDAEQVFYLRSRGLDEASARDVLTDAFAASMLERLADSGLRERVADRVHIQLREIGETSR